MSKYRVKIELPDGYYSHYTYFNESSDDDAHSKCYDLADKGWYKLYKRTANNGMKGYHWERKEIPK